MSNKVWNSHINLNWLWFLSYLPPIKQYPETHFTEINDTRNQLNVIFSSFDFRNNFTNRKFFPKAYYSIRRYFYLYFMAKMCKKSFPFIAYAFVTIYYMTSSAKNLSAIFSLQQCVYIHYCLGRKFIIGYECVVGGNSYWDYIFVTQLNKYKTFFFLFYFCLACILYINQVCRSICYYYGLPNVKGLIRKNCETIHHHHKYDDFANTFETTNTKLMYCSMCICVCYFRFNMIRELLFSPHYCILVVVVVIHKTLLSAFHLQQLAVYSNICV